MLGTRLRCSLPREEREQLNTLNDAVTGSNKGEWDQEAISMVISQPLRSFDIIPLRNQSPSVKYRLLSEV